MTPREQAEQAARDVLGAHYMCEDCWYSCPKSKEGCCNEAAGDDCTCGLDARIEKVTTLLLSQRAAVLEEVRRKFYDNAMTDAQFSEWLVQVTFMEA